MSLVIILPSEQALLLKRRPTLVGKNEAILHSLDSDVFYYCCSQTDWQTGIIGAHSAISYGGIALALSEDIPRKAKQSLRIVKRKCVYNSIQRLIKAGLLRSESLPIPEQKRLVLRRVFWQACITAPYSAKNPDSRQMAGFITAMQRMKTFNNNHLDDLNTPPKSRSYPADGTYKNTINITNAAEKKFRMTLTWQYDEKFVDLFLHASGFSVSQIKQVWFGKYVQYWSQQAMQRSQHEWQVHFANHMQGYLLRPYFFEEVNGMTDYLNNSNNARRDKACLVSTITVPMLRDGTQLQAWAVANGLPEAPVGFDTTAYYRFLCQQVKQLN